MGQVTSKMGLAAWNLQLDNYDYNQLANNWNIVDFHDHSPGRGVQIGTAGIAPGAILPQHLTSSLLQDLGLNGGSNTGRGAFAKTTSDSTSNGTFTALGDTVTGLVLNTNGIIEILYHAFWNVSAGTGTAGVFLTPSGGSATQTLRGDPTAGTSPVQITTTSTFASPLYTSGINLATSAAGSSQSDSTTGMTIGGSMWIYAAAGTYDVSVRFLCTGGTVTVQARHLWVKTVNYV